MSVYSLGEKASASPRGSTGGDGVRDRDGGSSSISSTEFSLTALLRLTLPPRLRLLTAPPPLLLGPGLLNAASPPPPRLGEHPTHQEEGAEGRKWRVRRRSEDSFKPPR